MNELYLKNVLEAAMLAAGRPLTLAEFAQLFEESSRPTTAELRAVVIGPERKAEHFLVSRDPRCGSGAAETEFDRALDVTVGCGRGGPSSARRTVSVGPREMAKMPEHLAQGPRYAADDSLRRQLRLRGAVQRDRCSHQTCDYGGARAHGHAPGPFSPEW